MARCSRIRWCRPPLRSSCRRRPKDLAVRHFHRHIDASWRRTSYSGLIRAAETAGGVPASRRSSSSTTRSVTSRCPSRPIRGDGCPVADGRPADGREVRHAGARGAGDRRPVRRRPGGRTARRQIREHSVWWPVDVPAAELAAALVPLHDTPLGPLAPGVTLRQIGASGSVAGDGLRVPARRR